jgi:Domain of unknown function (DUF4360)
LTSSKPTSAQLPLLTVRVPPYASPLPHQLTHLFIITAREKFCDFEVTFQFPLGCTTGTITTVPRGTIRLEQGFSSTWQSQYTISPGQLGPNPANVVTRSSDLPVTPGNWYDYVVNHPITVRETISNQNQRNVTFTARTRIFLTAPGPTRESTLIIDAADISVENTATC